MKEENQDLPGIGGQQFKVIINKDWMAPIELLEPIQLEVTKVLKQTWWKKFKFWLGFSVSFYEVKIKIRKHQNGGVCDCLDNLSSDDTYEEKSSYLDFEEDEEDDSISPKEKGRFTDDSDLWFTN